MGRVEILGKQLKRMVAKDRDGSFFVRHYDVEGRRTETPWRLLGQERGFRGVNLLQEPLADAEQQALTVKVDLDHSPVVTHASQ